MVYPLKSLEPSRAERRRKRLVLFFT